MTATLTTADLDRLRRWAAAYRTMTKHLDTQVHTAGVMEHADADGHMPYIDVADVEALLATVTGIQIGMPPIILDGEASNTWLDFFNDRQGWSITVTMNDGRVIEGTIGGGINDADNDGLASLVVEPDDSTDEVIIESSEIARVHVW